LIVDDLTCDFITLKQKVISIKSGRRVMIMWTEETFIPWEYNMEIINHHDTISFGKWGPRPFFFSEFCFMFIYFSLLLFCFIAVVSYMKDLWLIHKCDSYLVKTRGWKFT
jgi:hypothetical protein